MKELSSSQITKAIAEYLQSTNNSSFMPKAILFDMDGVLYDSMKFHARSWHETALNHNLVADKQLFYLYEGRTGESTINELYQKTFNREATEEEKNSIYKEKAELFNLYNDGKAMVGADKVLEEIKKYTLQTLVVTGSGQHSLINKLNHTYPGCFDRNKMVTAYDVVYGKPHPEPYLMGLEKAGVKANEAIVIENAPLGVEAAVAAGIFTIAVNTGPLEDNVLLDKGANLLFDDMNSLAKAFPLLMATIGAKPK